MLRIDLWPKAQKFLDTLPAKRQRQVSEKILELSSDPFPSRSKQLEGFAPLRRIRVGDYRVIYFVEGEIITVALVDARADDKIYRRLKQLFD